MVYLVRGGGLMPAPFVPFFAVGTAALSGDNLPVNKIPDYAIDRTGYAEEYFDVVGTEEVNGPRPHPPGKDMGYLVFCEKGWQSSGFVAGAL